MLNTFYFETTRKLVVAFGTLFNDIHVMRKDASGIVQKDIKVPLAFAPREHYLARLREEIKETADKTAALVQVTLPRMSFELVSLTRDTQRASSALNQYVAVDQTNPQANVLLSQYECVPYDVGFQLSIYSKHIDDMLQIVEQIIPYFNPTFNVPLKLIPELGVVYNTPISLESVSPSDTYESAFDDTRYIIWDMDFIAKVAYFPPIQDANVITKVITNYKDTDLSDIERITITPLPLGATKDTMTDQSFVFEYPPYP